MTITPKHRTNMPEFTDTFIKAGLNKGWLIPPRDGYPRSSEELLNWVIWLLIAAGAGILAWVAFA